MNYNDLVNLNNRNKEIFKRTRYDEKAKEFCKYRIEKREDGHWWGTPINGLHRFDVCFRDISCFLKFFEEVKTFHIMNVSKFIEDLTPLNNYYLSYNLWCEIEPFLKNKTVEGIIIKRVDNLQGYLGKRVLDGYNILFNNNFIACIQKDNLCELVSNFVIMIDNKTNFNFAYFDYLRYIQLSNLYMKELTSLSEFFIGCLSLEKILLKGLDTRNVTNFSRMFEGCVCLKTLDLKILNTQAAKNFEGMFRHCLQLESLDLSSFSVCNVEDIREMFCRCKRMTKLNIKGWNLSNCIRCNNLFLDCTKNLCVDRKAILSIKFEYRTDIGNVILI